VPLVQHDTPERIIANVGHRVAEARRALGWTQEEAAEKLRMPLPNLRRYEAGVNLTLRTLVRLARGLRVTTRSLLDEPKDRRSRRRGRPKEQR
jgi:transcriptional regulator with XRE-family HTH domain